MIRARVETQGLSLAEALRLTPQDCSQMEAEMRNNKRRALVKDATRSRFGAAAAAAAKPRAFQCSRPRGTQVLKSTRSFLR